VSAESDRLSPAPDLRYPRYVLVDWHPHARALAEARAWCTRRFDPTRPAESLRTPALRPPGYPDDWLYGALDCGAVAALIDRRRSLLADPPSVWTAAGVTPDSSMLARITALLLASWKSDATAVPNFER